MSGTISTVLTNSYTLSVDPTTITKTGGVEVLNSYAAIIGPSPTAWTVHNEGTVSDAGSAFASGGYGVLLEAGGTITNSAGASIVGGILARPNGDGGAFYYGAGIDVRGAGTVVNAGTITDVATDFYGSPFGQGVTLASGGDVTNMDGGVIAGSWGGIVSGGAANVTNDRGATITATRDGVSLSGRVTNAGTITGGSIGAEVVSGRINNEAGGVISGSIGIWTAGTVANSGSITGKEVTAKETTGGLVSYYDGVGVDLAGGGRITNHAGGVIMGGGIESNGILAGGTGVVSYHRAATVVNAGTIGGGSEAVALAAGYANRVVFDPGAVFEGTVDGGNAIGAPVASTLELAAGGSGTLYNLNVSFVDFAHIAIDKGADWELASGNILAGQTVTDAGTLYNTGIVSLPGEIVLHRGTLEGGLNVAPGGILAGSGTVAGGEVTVAAGAALVAGGGTLTLAHLNLTLSGTLEGNEIAVDDASIEFGSGAHASVHTIALTDGSLFFGAGGVYHGALDASDGGIGYGEGNATLTGPVSLVRSSVSGGGAANGRLTLAGKTEVNGAFVVYNDALLVDSGSLAQRGNVVLETASDLRVAATGTWDIATDTGIRPGPRATGSITNVGTFEKTGGTGTSVISADFVNYGTIIAESGTLDFTGGFANYGHIIDNGGTVIIGPASPALFNQHVAGAVPASSASIVATAPPETKNTPLLATPHAA